MFTIYYKKNSSNGEAFAYYKRVYLDKNDEKHTLVFVAPLAKSLRDGSVTFAKERLNRAYLILVDNEILAKLTDKKLVFKLFFPQKSTITSKPVKIAALDQPNLENIISYIVENDPNEFSSIIPKDVEVNTNKIKNIVSSYFKESN